MREVSSPGATEPAPCRLAAFRPGSQAAEEAGARRRGPGPVSHSGQLLLRAGVAGLRSAVGAGRRLAESFPGSGSGSGALSLSLGELEDKLRVFELFRWAEEAAGGAPDLAAGVRGALRLAPWDAVWVLEGLGYARGAGAAGPGEGPGDRIPRRWWIPLHTGTGMALAEGALAELGGLAPDAVRRRVAALAERCAALSAPGYALATFEPFGFMVRMLEPTLLPVVATALGRPERGGGDGDLAAAFWHGAGRGFYFTPFAASGGHGLEAAWRGAPARAEALEALAGAAWALTLVNLPRPGVVAAALARAEERLPAEALPAVADGVASAVRLWHHGRGTDRVLAAFLDHRACREEVPGAWERLAVEPCRRALAVAGEPGSGRPGDLFRHHPGGPS